MAKTFTFEEAAAPATFSFEEALGPAEAGGTGLIQSARSAPMLYGEDPINGAMQPQSSMPAVGPQTAVVTDPSGDGSVLKGVKFDPPDADPYLNRQARDRSVSPQSKMFTPAQELDRVDAYISRGEKIQAALKKAGYSSVDEFQAARQRSSTRQRIAEELPVLSGVASGAANQVAGLANFPQVTAEFVNKVFVDPVLTATGGSQMPSAPKTPGTESLMRAAADYMPKVGKKEFEDVVGTDEFRPWLIANMAQNSPQMVMSLASMLAPAVRPFVLPGMGATSAGNAYLQGDDPRVAMAKGAVEVGSEMLPLGVFDKIQSAIASMPRSAQKRFLADVGKRVMSGGAAVAATALTGGAEEWIAQYGGNVLDKYAQGKNIPLDKGAAGAYVLGAAMGTGMGMPHIISAMGDQSPQAQAERELAALLNGGQFSDLRGDEFANLNPNLAESDPGPTSSDQPASAADIFAQRWGKPKPAVPDPVATVQSATSIDGAITAAAQAVDAAFNERDRQQAKSEQAVSNIARILGTEIPDVGTTAAVPGVVEPADGGGTPDGTPGVGAGVGAAGAAGQPVDAGGVGGQPAGGAVSLGAGQPGALNFAQPPGPVRQITVTPAGTLTAIGDPKALVRLLKSAGVTNVIPATNGITVGKSQASMARQVLDDFVAAPPENFEQDFQQELEREYQADIKAQLLAKRNPPPVKVEKKTQSPLRTMLRTVGIKPELAADITGERNKVRANNVLPFTFRKNGAQIDELVRIARERGFLTQDEDDISAGRRLVEMIQADLRGDRQESTETIDDAMRGEQDADIARAAARYGLDISGMEIGQVANAVNRIERRLEKARADGLRREAAAEARLEREAIQAADRRAAGPDRILDDLDDVPENATLEDAMRARGFTEQEISDAVAQESRRAQADRAGSGDVVAAAAGPAQGSDRRGESQARQEAGGAESRPQDLLGDAPNASQQAAARLRAEREEQDRRRQQDAPSPDDFMMSGSDRAADVGDAAGQGDLLATSPVAESQAPAPAAKAGARPLDAIDVRKAKSRVEGSVRNDMVGTALYALSEPSLWYSELSRQIKSAKMEASKPEGWKALISGLTQKGVKPDEIEWSGIREWLGLQQGKVTKQQVLEYLDGNGVRVQEVVKGSLAGTTAMNDARVRLDAMGYTLNDEPGSITVTRRSDGVIFGYNERAEGFEGIIAEREEGRYEVDFLPEDVEQWAMVAHNVATDNYDSDDDAPGETRYSTYQLPGGQNYREVLLTLPKREPGPQKFQIERIRETPSGGVQLRVTMDGKSATVSRTAEGFPFRVDYEKGESDRGGKTEDEAIEVARAGLAQRALRDAPTYRSSHWSEPNVLAHIRLNDRTDAQGRRVLFVEELQSDWAQAGRKEGFGPKQYEVIAPNPNDRGAKWEVRSRGQQLGWVHGANEREALSEARRIFGVFPTIPRAPFVDSTDKWLTLALKRVMVMAAQEGYDAVAFVNGEQSADRYDLSKHVDEIHILRTGDNFDLGFKVDGRYGQVPSQKTDIEGLENIVGKEMAKRIAESPEGRSYLSGEQLKVGGEGMIAFYDKIVPAAVNKLLGKVGGGKLEGVRLSIRKSDSKGEFYDYASGAPFGQSGAPYVVIDQNGVEVASFKTKAEAVAEVERLNAETATEQEQPGFTITPEMREKLAGGMPLFGREARMPSGLTMQDARDRIREMRGADIGQVRAIVDSIRKTWKGGPSVEVVASYRDLPGRPVPGARGMYIGGKVYVVASSHRAGGNLRQAVAKTLSHEVIAHYGLRKILGADFDRLLTKPLQLAIASGNKPMTALRDQVRRLYVDEDGNFTLTRREEADEIAARAVENAIDEDGNFRPGYSWLKSVWARVAQFLRDMGVDVEFTLAELQGMLVQAQQAVRKGERLAGGSTVVVTQQPALSRRSAEDVAPAEGFWSRIKAGKSFTPQEIADAYARGVLGTVRAFAGFSGEKGGMAAVPGTEHAGWRDEIAGFDGYVTVGVSFADGSLAMGVIPRELYPGRGSALGLGDLGEYSLATYAFTPNPDGSYRLDVFDPRRGGRVFDELARRGRLEETGDTDVAGQPYYRAVFDNRYTTSHSLIQEAVRRLGYHLGAVPTVVQIGRDTGSRANPGKEQVRTFTPEFIERRLARGESRDTTAPVANPKDVAGNDSGRPAGDNTGGNRSRPAFDNAAGDYNPDLPKFWLKQAARDIGDSMVGASDAEYHTAIAERANAARIGELLEEMGWRRRGSSNLSMSAYFEKYDDDTDTTTEIRVSDHDDFHPADDSIARRYQVNFRGDASAWADADISADMTSDEARALLRGMLNEPAASEGSDASADPDIRYALASNEDIDAEEAPAPRSRWLDDAGRLRFLPGTIAYDLLGKAATPLLNRVYLKTQSKPLRRAIREMKLTVQKAQDTAEEIGREVVKLTDAEREMVSDIIEKELSTGVVPPEHAVKLAATMNEVLGKQTDELVKLGMLATDTAEQWRGKYLARYYKDKLGARVQSAWDKAISTFGAKPMRGLRGNHFKGRGLFEVIPEAELPAWEANGWEVRDPDYQEGITKDGTVRVWRDFTRAEREKMGEIRDAGFRFVMGYMETQKDIALGRMFQAIAADPELSSRYQTEEHTEFVKDGTISGTGVKKYGKLAGRWVSRETISHLSQIEESQSEVFKMYRKAMGLWKETKTSLNPVAHANNIVSNITMAHFAGVSYWDGHKYAQAMRDFATKSASVQEAKDAGLFLGTVSDAELMNVLPEDLKAIVRQQEGTLTKVGSNAFNAMTWFLRRPMGAAYQAEDTFFRYLIWKDARDRGMSSEDAVDYSLRYIFAYDDLPRTARIARDFFIPFVSYTYKAIPALLHTAANYPWRFAAPAAVMWGVNAAAYAIAVGDDDDDWIERLQKYLTDPAYREKAKAREKLEREYLPEWMKGKSIMGTPKAIRLGMDEVTKLPLFIDVYRMVPGGDMLDMNNNAGGTPWLQPFTPNHPLLTTYMAMFGNRDGWTGKDVVDKTDDSTEAAQKRLGWLWRQTAPALAYGNYHFERTMQALAQATGKPVQWAPEFMGGMEATGVGKDGLPVQPKYAAMQTFGLKVRPIDVEMGEIYDNAAKNKLIREIDAEMRRLGRLNAKGAVSDANFDREAQKANVKRDRINDGLTIDGKPKN